MKSIFLKNEEVVVDLPITNGISKFIIEKSTVAAINIAIASGKPLLLRGEGSFPKRELGVAAAILLNKAIIEMDLGPDTELGSFLWDYDRVARLAEAQILQVHSDRVDTRASLHPKHFITPGPLWWAFDSESSYKQSTHSLIATADFVRTIPPIWQHTDGSVFIVEGIDLCERSIPLRLSKILKRGQFHTPINEQVVNKFNPLIIFTTDEERMLNSSFLKGCIVHTTATPSSDNEFEAYLIKWGIANFPDSDKDIITLAANILTEEREYYLNRAIDTPGVREFLDLIRGAENISSAHEEKFQYLEYFRIMHLHSFGEKPIKNNSTTSIFTDGITENVNIEESANLPEIFISYASSENHSLAERLYNTLKEGGHNVKIDKIDIQYKDLVSKYINALGGGGAVIALVSDSYLRSTYCMWELLKVYENKDFQDRLFPVVFPGANITDGVGRLRYTVYWQDRHRELQEAMRQVDTLSISQETIAEATRLREFVDKVDLLSSKVADMNFRPMQDLTEDSLKSLELSLKDQLDKI